MKAVWHLGAYATDAHQAIEFVRDLGFNTLITGGATPDMVAHARTTGIRLIAVITAGAGDAFVQQYPHAVQKMCDIENRISETLSGQPWDSQTASAFRWHPILQRNAVLCFEHPESRAELQRRVQQALALADGVALDGFGFANHYACFCDRCEAIRTGITDAPELEVMARMSAQSLIDIHQVLYEHAKSINPQAMVVNHVWPPFRPDEYIGFRFRLDYCTQTIAWFYPPVWRIERVEMEAAEMKRLEDPAINRFVPFIGIHDVNGLVRSPEQLAAELDIALKYGEGSLVVSRLNTLQTHPALAAVVKNALRKGN